MARREKPPKGTRPEDDAPRLFDAPLFGPGEVRPDAVPARPGEVPPEPPREPEPSPEPARELQPEPPFREPAPAAAPAPPHDDAPEASLEESPREPRLTLGRRWTAGVVDLGLHAAALGLALAGQIWLGVPPSWDHAAPLGLFLAAFSFLYCTVPLAFWGQTPGMAAFSLAAHNAGSHNLTFGQTLVRWLGGVLTVALLGLPLVLAGRGPGRSLADRLSGSRTSLRLT